MKRTKRVRVTIDGERRTVYLSKTLEECETTGDYMRYNREIRGYNMKALAAASGVCYATLDSWERGFRNPSLPPMMLVCDVLGITLDEYVGRKAVV